MADNSFSLVDKIFPQSTEAYNPVSTVKVTVEPNDSLINKSFSNIRQGIATNTLTKLNAKEGKGLTVDNVTGNATITNGNTILSIAGYKQLTDLKTSTYQLFDAITLAFTESGSTSPTVVIPLTEYMTRRGLKDRKEAKAQVIADMAILMGASLQWVEKQGNKEQTFGFMNIADSGQVKRNGDIIFTFGNTFYSNLLEYPIMPYPVKLQALNSKRNPNSYYFGRKITEHKNMNYGKKNEDLIAVKTLLSIAPFIPSYEEVKRGDRALSKHIIEPFERDMDALKDILSWHYCHSLGQELTNEELEKMDYNIFKDLLVHINWNDYQTRKEKSKAIEKTKNSKSKSKKGG